MTRVTVSFQRHYTRVYISRLIAHARAYIDLTLLDYVPSSRLISRTIRLSFFARTRARPRNFYLMGNVTGNDDERRNDAKGDARDFINAARARAASVVSF